METYSKEEGRALEGNQRCTWFSGQDSHSIAQQNDLGPLHYRHLYGKANLAPQQEVDQQASPQSAFLRSETSVIVVNNDRNASSTLISPQRQSVDGRKS